MTDDQFRQIMDAVSKLAMRVEEAHLRLATAERIADERQRLLYQWVAPPEYKRRVDEPAEEIQLPDDIRNLLKP